MLILGVSLLIISGPDEEQPIASIDMVNINKIEVIEFSIFSLLLLEKICTWAGESVPTAKIIRQIYLNIIDLRLRCFLAIVCYYS
jgi:hypothetical protein